MVSSSDTYSRRRCAHQVCAKFGGGGDSNQSQVGPASGGTPRARICEECPTAPYMFHQCSVLKALVFEMLWGRCVMARCHGNRRSLKEYLRGRETSASAPAAFGSGEKIARWFDARQECRGVDDTPFQPFLNSLIQIKGKRQQVSPICKGKKPDSHNEPAV